MSLGPLQPSGNQDALGDLEQEIALTSTQFTVHNGNSA